MAVFRLAAQRRTNCKRKQYIVRAFKSIAVVVRLGFYTVLYPIRVIDMRKKLEIQKQLEHLQKRLDKLSTAKEEDIGYVAEDTALKERIRLLKWVIGEE